MSMERPKAERLPMKAPHSPEPVAISEAAAGVSEVEELAQVRTRLGLPSRRGFLGGLATLAVAGKAERARAERTPAPRTPEQLRIYTEGLRALRESARTDADERASAFLVAPDGSSSWRAFDDFSTRSIRTDGVVAATGILDLDTVEALRKERAEGATLEYVHTHPTKLVMGNAEYQTPLPGADRLPPSPTDIVSSVHEFASVSPEEAERLRFTVVTEAGTWSYGPRSVEAAKQLSDAFDAATPALGLLENQKEGASVLAGYLRKRFSDDGVDLGEQMTAIIDFIGEGNFSLFLDADAVARFGLVYEYLKDDPDAPPEALAYAKTFVLAEEEVKAALRRIAPRTDGQIGSVPLMANPEPYLARWRELGVDLAFTPFGE